MKTNITQDSIKPSAEISRALLAGKRLLNPQPSLYRLRNSNNRWDVGCWRSGADSPEMNPAQKQFPVNRASFKKQFPISIFFILSVLLVPVAGRTAVLARPDLFRIEKFAEFTMPPLTSFGLLLSDGTRGFDPGLLVSTGPLTNRDKVLFVNPSGQVSVLASGFTSAEGMVFATGAYGGGVLISSIASGQIVRLLADGTKSTFSTGFTQPGTGLGPAQLTYGPGGVLYASDFGSGTIRRVDPFGNTTVFAAFGIYPKGIGFVPSNLYGARFICSTFNFNDAPFTGKIFRVSLDGTNATEFVTGLQGLQLLTVGDAAAFTGPQSGSIHDLLDGRILVPSIGLEGNDDGNLSILNPDGSLSLLISGIDASSVVFDTVGALGGGMFVTDLGPAAQTIWHITPTTLGPTVERLRGTQFGTAAIDYATGASPDGAGGLYLTGVTHGDLGGTNAGNSDVWLARWDANGVRLWMRQIGTAGNEDCHSPMIVHNAGLVYVIGSTDGSLAKTNAGADDYWLARYNASGSQIWIRQFGSGAVDCTHTKAVGLDGIGGVYLCGDTSGNLAGPNAGLGDAWLARYDTNGNQLWIRQVGTISNDYATATAPDGAGGVYLIGYTEGSLGGTNAGRYDAWISRYDGGGQPIWTRQFGTDASDWVTTARPDGAGGLYLCGGTGGSLGGAYVGEADGWVARYDGTGQRIWIRQFGSSGNEFATSCVQDGEGGLFVTAWTDSSLAGPNRGARDFCVFHYNGQGTRLRARQFGTSSSDEVWLTVFDPVAGTAYVGGWTEGNLYRTNAGLRDAFFAPIEFLDARSVGTNVVLSWVPSTAVLETAIQVTGPWSQVVGASSPYNVPAPLLARQFFRLRP